MIQKKLIRDLGLETSAEVQQHMRRNLLQIIQVEVLLENAGWDTNPGERRDNFESLDGEMLCEDLTQFWKLCTENRNSRILSLAEHKPVDFTDVYSLISEKEEKLTKKDCKKMSRELPNMAATIPDTYPLKVYLCNQISDVIKSKNYEKILELYELVSEAIDFELAGISSESECDGDDGD